MKREVVVVAGCRTAQGTFGGTLRDVPAHVLVQTPLLEVVGASTEDNVETIRLFGEAVLPKLRSKVA